MDTPVPARKNKLISPLLYYFLVSGLISLVIGVIGAGVLAICSYEVTSGIFICVILLLLFWKSGLVGFMGWLFHKESPNKAFYIKFMGSYLGGFYGLFIGGFAGARIAYLLGQADWIGVFAGVLVFYFIGRWIGPFISLAIGRQLDKVGWQPADS